MKLKWFFINFNIFISLVLVLPVDESWAWGKRGHNAVGTTAARILGFREQLELPKKHAFDLGYMNNVPDVIWKSDNKTYEIESPQHWIDLEPYLEKVKEGTWNSQRAAFVQQYPDLKVAFGRAPWRIHEMQNRLLEIKGRLEKMPFPAKPEEAGDYHKAQEEWIITAGTMGHYVADLSQPLHVTLDYDGEKCTTKGLHSFFEENVVDELAADLEAKIYDQAVKEWSAFKRANSNRPAFELVLNLAKESFGQVGDLCKWDKKRGRDARKVAPQYFQFITERLARSSVVLAVLWERSLHFKYHGAKFWNFSGAPTYLAPEKETP